MTKRTFNCPKCNKVLKDGEGERCGECEGKELICFSCAHKEAMTLDSVHCSVYTMIVREKEDCVSFEPITSDNDPFKATNNFLRAQLNESAKPPKSTQAKLKEIVEKMIEGGWHAWQKYEFVSATKQDHGIISVILMHREEDGDEAYYDYSMTDLITNPDAMGAVFGEELVCASCGALKDSKKYQIRCASCHLIGYKRSFVYHGLKAAELLLTQGQQQSIEYIWKECGE